MRRNAVNDHYRLSFKTTLGCKFACLNCQFTFVFYTIKCGLRLLICHCIASKGKKPVLTDLKVFEGAAARMMHASERHKLITGNIANATTPNYVGHDLRAFRLTDMPLGMNATRSGHLGGVQDDPYAALREPQVNKVFDETLNHNGVSVEQELTKAADALGSHAMASAVWQKSLDILRLSLGNKG